jgi:hypothetical protein
MAGRSFHAGLMGWRVTTERMPCGPPTTPRSSRRLALPLRATRPRHPRPKNAIERVCTVLESEQDAVFGLWPAAYIEYGAAFSLGLTIGSEWDAAFGVRIAVCSE